MAGRGEPEVVPASAAKERGTSPLLPQPVRGRPNTTVWGAKHPFQTSAVWRRLTWAWLFPILRLGRCGLIQPEDVWELPEAMRAKDVLDAFDAYRAQHPQHRLWRVMVGMYMPRWLLAGACYLVWCAIAILQPLLVRRFVQFLEDEDAERSEGFIIAVLLFLDLQCYAFAINYKFHHLTVNGTHMRNVLMSAIARKSLSLALNAGGNVGQATNLLSNDTERLYEMQLFLHYLYLAPLFVLAVVVLMYLQIGPASFIGFGVLFLMLPIMSFSGKLIGKSKDAMLQQTDRRTELISQVLRGVQIVKAYAWEEPFASRVHDLRVQEVKHLRKIQYVKAALRSMLYIFPPLVSFITLATAVALGEELTLGKVIVTLSYINVLRFPMLLIPHAYGLLAEGTVSIRRVEAFLSLEDTRAPRLAQAHDPSPGGTFDIQAKDAVFGWATATEKDAFAVGPVSLSVPGGQLIGVVGAVGSGKTTLAYGLLRELDMAEGELVFRRDGAEVANPHVGVVEQTPIVLQGSFKDNIVFGRPYDEALFQRVVSQACLHHDLELLPHGDETEIGERGVNLSGGQKSRVAFARVLYDAQCSRACDFVLLDDPFASVDVAVANRMFQEGVQGALRGKTRVLVLSSHLELLEHADQIVVLDGGRVSAKGDYQTLFGPSGRSSALLSQASEASAHKEEEAQGDGAGSTQGGDGDAKGALVTAEDRKEGAVGTKYVALYASMVSGDRNGRGVLVVASVLLAFLTGEVIRVFGDVWLTWWADPEAADGIPRELVDKPDGFWTWTLGLIVAVFSSLVFLRSLYFVKLAVRSGQHLHETVLQNLLYAPLLFFHQNPAGRVLNRFSSDVHRIDLTLPDFMFQFLEASFVLFSAIVFAFIAVPFLFAVFLPLALAFYFTQSYFRATSRQLLRLDGITKSPIFSEFSQNLRARCTIRALQATGRVGRKMQDLMDTHLKLFFVVRSLERLISVGLNSLSSTLALSLMFASVFARDAIDPNLVGLALVYCMQLMGLGSWAIKLFVNLENNLTSVERLAHYLDIPREGAETRSREGEHGELDSKWPAHGAISITNLSLRYRPGLPLTLKGLDLEISPGEKVGVCGRTGAGKSSLMLALFRLYEPEATSRVEIDGVNTAQLGLKALRRRLGIIPQDPVVFSGTLRYNLDPFGDHADASIWAALEKTQLKEVAASLPAGLDSVISGGGQSTISHGQRQLVCIARALLRDCKVLFCDEATSSVDPATDATIQEILRAEFKGCTVLTIAHRLDTIIHSDRILVLEDGRVVEYDSPGTLLADPTTRFARMVDMYKGQETEGGVTPGGLGRDADAPAIREVAL